jgi:hypothetical protein
VIAARIRDHFAVPEPAAQLAALRIVVAVMFLWLPEVRHAAERAAIPAALRVVPEGLGWFVALVPITPALARVAQVVAAFAAFCAIAGVRARVALGVLSVAGFYLLALSQLSGWVWKDMHVLWMAALLAASPCDDALAFDRRGVPDASDSRRYGVPLTFARLLLACVYFFPGFHKLRVSGLAWALSDNLRNQLYWKWAEHGVTSPWRYDRVPHLLQVGGLFVLAFEIGFPVLVLTSRRTRMIALVAGLAFHLMAWWLLRIAFVSLWAQYVVLVDPAWVRSVFARWRGTRVVTVASDDVRASRATPWCGSLLLAGAIVQGARGQMRAFPFACYPTFERIAGVSMPDLRIEVERADGTWVEIVHARDARGYRTQREWGEIWSLAGVNDPVNEARLRAYFVQTVRRSPRARMEARGAIAVRFERTYRDVRPEHRGDPARAGPVLAQFTLAR